MPKTSVEGKHYPMGKVLCPQNEMKATPANARQGKNVGSYRCTKCGNESHTKA